MINYWSFKWGWELRWQYLIFATWFTKTAELLRCSKVELQIERQLLLVAFWSPAREPTLPKITKMFDNVRSPSPALIFINCNFNKLCQAQNTFYFAFLFCIFVNKTYKRDILCFALAVGPNYDPQKYSNIPRTNIQDYRRTSIPLRSKLM